jgi:hypothetical protein
VSVGVRAEIVATTSYSAEHRPLTFAWRLSRRPAGSTARIADAMATALTLTPDVPGDYDVELRVFDGELWSAPVGETVHVVP